MFATKNDQRDALRQFLQLYALSADSGTRDALKTHIVNGADKNVVLGALFGNGSQTGGIVSQVHIGGSTYTNASGIVNHQNPYANINKILDELGIDASPVQDHHNHFHIYLAPPAPVNITASLLAESVADTPQTMGAVDILTAAQTLLSQIQPDTQEESLMFIMDVPNIPAQEPPLMVADASAAQNTAQKYDRVIGVCHLSANPYVPLSAVNSLSPPLAIKGYYRNEEHYKIEGQASVSVLQMPVHGVLVDDGGGIMSISQRKAISAMIALACWLKWAARKSGWNTSSA